VLQQQSGQEGFLDVMLGTNCYTRAVRGLKRDCAALATDTDGSLWLAFHLMNCHFSHTGRRPYTCGHASVAACVDRLTRDDYLIFTQFSQARAPLRSALAALAAVVKRP
jgi:hypothetical protein